MVSLRFVNKIKCDMRLCFKFAVGRIVMVYVCGGGVEHFVTAAVRYPYSRGSEISSSRLF